MQNAGMAGTVYIPQYRFGCRRRSAHAIRLLTTKPATGGDVIFAAFKKDAGGYSRRRMDFKLLDRV